MFFYKYIYLFHVIIILQDQEGFIVREQELLEKGYRKYRGKLIDVFFNKDMCIKSGNCVAGAPEVFNTKEKPWIKADNASKDKVMEVINTCPSRALQYILKDESELHRFDFEDGRFFLNNDSGKMVAEITYTKAGENILIIDHTFVDPVLRGQGIALKLVEAVIKLAIDQGKKIMPLCPYAKSVFDKNEELNGILHK